VLTELNHILVIVNRAILVCGEMSVMMYSNYNVVTFKEKSGVFSILILISYSWNCL
jgi:hypothetical protein